MATAYTTFTLDSLFKEIYREQLKKAFIDLAIYGTGQIMFESSLDKEINDIETMGYPYG